MLEILALAVMFAAGCAVIGLAKAAQVRWEMVEYRRPATTMKETTVKAPGTEEA